MRAFLQTTTRAALIAAAMTLAVSSVSNVAHAQTKGESPDTSAPQPKQIKLTQKGLDGLIAAQKEIREIDAKAPKDAKQPDPKLEAQINAAVKKNGFASVGEFADASYSVGMVLAGMDPDSGKYVGLEAATKKQIDEVKADKQMPPKEKKEALDELNETLKAAGTDKPDQGNIDLVTANVTKLNEGLRQAD